jgi:hypothetical protein
MYQINQLTADPLQTMTLILPNGNPCQLTIYYIERQIGWFITNLTYGDFQLSGIRITNNPNMLYQWKNILPFGLACYSTNQTEPGQLQDFFSQNSILYILDASEVEDITGFYQNGG